MWLFKETEMNNQRVKSKIREKNNRIERKKMLQKQDMKCVHHTTSKRKLMTLSVATDYLFVPRAYEVTT